MTSEAKQIAAGAGLGLLSGAAGATVCLATYTAGHQRYSVGDIGDLGTLVIGVLAFGAGLPLGAVTGAIWPPARPHRYLTALLCIAGAVAAVALLFDERFGRR